MKLNTPARQHTTFYVGRLMRCIRVVMSVCARINSCERRDGTVVTRVASSLFIAWYRREKFISVLHFKCERYASRRWVTEPWQVDGHVFSNRFCVCSVGIQVCCDGSGRCIGAENRHRVRTGARDRHRGRAANIPPDHVRDDSARKRQRLRSDDGEGELVVCARKCTCARVRVCAHRSSIRSVQYVHLGKTRSIRKFTKAFIHSVDSFHKFKFRMWNTYYFMGLSRSLPNLGSIGVSFSSVVIRWVLNSIDYTRSLS